MALYFVIRETRDKKFIKLVYDTSDECHHYLASLLRVAQAKPENYRVLSHSDTELTIEETVEQGISSQRKYTVVQGEVTDMANMIQGHPDVDSTSL
jgi:hypothetical protein